MLNQYARNWWVLAVRGIAAIIFGVLAFVWPGITFLVLVLLFGAYALVDGVFAIIHAFTHREGHTRWWVLLLEGIVSIAAGLIAWSRPGLAAFALLMVIAAWAILTGVLEIVAAMRLREEIKDELLLALSGIASVVFGGLLVLNPIVGSLAVIWIIGAYAIIFGAIELALAWRLHSLGTRRHAVKLTG
jgi:uncharacterized membrane protein HdeD (DUF308 family)